MTPPTGQPSDAVCTAALAAEHIGTKSKDRGHQAEAAVRDRDARIAAVRELHRPLRPVAGEHCRRCLTEPWPCPTIRALDGPR